MRKIKNYYANKVRFCSNPTCSRRNILLPFSEFYKDKHKKDGILSACKICTKQVDALRRIRERNTPKRKFKYYRDKARERNLEFSLTFDEFNIFWQKPCHYCGFDISTIGLDRKDNNLGYTIKNVVSCCCECNTAKFDLFTYKEMVSIIGKAIAKVKRNRNIVLKECKL
jgi:hypothetical protein